MSCEKIIEVPEKKSYNFKNSKFANSIQTFIQYMENLTLAENIMLI